MRLERGDERRDPDRRDPRAATGVLAEGAEHAPVALEVESDLLVRLARARCASRPVVAILVASARKAHVARPGVERMLGASQQQHGVLPQADHHRRGPARPFDRRMRAPGERALERREVGERPRHARRIADRDAC